MSKKELQAFMKAKLAKTKVTDSVTTGTSATGPAQRHFGAGARRDGPTQRKDFMSGMRKPPIAKKPGATPSSRAAKAKEPSDDEESEDDIFAANEKMKRAAEKLRVDSSKPMSKSKGRVVKQTSSAKGDFEEKKTVVRSTSKNIYKPCFNMPTKEPKQMSKADEVKSKKAANREAAKAFSEAQRKKQRETSSRRGQRVASQSS